MNWQRLAADAEKGNKEAGESLLRALKRAGFDEEASVADRALWHRAAPESLKEATERTTLFHTMGGYRFAAHVPESFDGAEWGNEWPPSITIDLVDDPRFAMEPIVGRFRRHTFKRVEIVVGARVWFEYFEVTTRYSSE